MATLAPSDAEVAQDDLRAILLALGLSDAARPYSCHECVHREVLPAIARLHVVMTLIDEHFLSEPCHYGDDCPDFGTRHGRCLSCEFKRAVAVDGGVG